MVLEPHVERHAGRADVGRIDEDLGHRQDGALGMVVVDAGIADDQREARIVAALQRGGAIVEGHGEGDRLDDRAQLEDAAGHPVHLVLAEVLVLVVRIEVRQRDKRPALRPW